MKQFSVCAWFPVANKYGIEDLHIEYTDDYITSTELPWSPYKYDGLWVISDSDGHGGVYKTLESALRHYAEWHIMAFDPEDSNKPFIFTVEVIEDIDFEGKNTGCPNHHLVLEIHDVGQTLISNQLLR